MIDNITANYILDMIILTCIIAGFIGVIYMGFLLIYEFLDSKGLIEKFLIWYHKDIELKSLHIPYKGLRVYK